jgi:PAS domain-containing protein
MTKLSEQIIAALSATEAGIYFLALESNTLYADGRVADFFDLPAEKAGGGMPLETYLERIHADDRAETAKAIYDAIVTGQPYHHHYRIVHEDQSVVHVLAIGQCFRNKLGIPSDYAGVIFNMSALDVRPDVAVADLCRAAYTIAIAGSVPSVAERLSSILADVERPGIHAGRQILKH